MAVTSKKHVVLPHGLNPKHVTPHHRDAWHQWEGLVVVLVAVHLAAMLFWGWLLYRSRSTKRQRKQGQPGPAPKGEPAKRAPPTWRTPREILAQYNKQLQGKV